MAQHQPAAYTYFDATALDSQTLLGDFALPERRSWTVGTPRDIEEVIVQAHIEVPVQDDDLPAVGDIVYLAKLGILSGPWTVTAAPSEPRVGNPEDLATVRVHTRALRGQRPPQTRWLQLRRLDDAEADDNPGPDSQPLTATPLSRDPWAAVPGSTDERIAERARAAETERFVGDVRAVLKQIGLPTPGDDEDAGATDAR